MKKYRDHYFMKAKQENYPARSVYKLKEIDKRFHIFKQGQRVLDLGAAPGSWSQVAAQLVGAQGRVFALDILPMEAIADELNTSVKSLYRKRTALSERLGAENFNEACLFIFKNKLLGAGGNDPWVGERSKA